MPDTKFPKGKLNANDEGELSMAFRHEKGNVILDFGKPVVWIGLPPKEAAQMASMLLKHARMVARETGDVIEFQI